MVISWVFANGPQISEKIKILSRRVKDCGFLIQPISGIIKKDELNPFEQYTTIKLPY